MSSRGQAATEYLVVLGAVLLVSAITVSILALSSDTSSAQVQESAAYWRSTYPFIITSAKAVGPAIVLTLQNTADEPLWLDGISAEGTRMLFYEYSGDVFGASRCPNGLDSCSIPVDIGQSVTVAARSPSECLSRSFSLDDVQFTYSNLDLTGLLQQGDKPLAGFCSQKVNGIALLPPSPANDTWFSAGSSVIVNATIQGMPLSGLNFTWNESTTRIYDDSLVLAMNFDDVPAVGDTAGKVVDVSQYGNNGTIYGNTALLLHMDEADGFRAADESRFGNNGTVYGNTLGLWHFDENSGNTSYDESVYRNNCTLYNSLTWLSCSSGSVNCPSFISGKYGRALQYNGNAFTLISSTVPAPSNQVSLEVWINIANTSISPLYEHIIRRKDVSDPSYNEAYGLSLGWTNRVVKLFISTDLKKGGNIQTPAELNVNQWYHVVGTYDAGTNYSRIYIDGNKVVESTTAIYGLVLPSQDLLTLGGSFNGTIDEVAIYNKSLTAAEVLDHYNAGRAKFAEWTAGKSETGLQFDGVNDYFVTSSFAIPASTNAVTYEFWAKSGTLSGIQTLLSEGVQTTNGFIWIYRASGSSHQMAFQYGNGTYYYAVYFPHTFDSGSNPDFIHLVVVADYTANSVSVYRNGAYLSSASMVAGLFPSSNRPKYLGAFGGNKAYFNGTLDEIGIYPRALTPAEILAHYNAGKAKHADWTPDGNVGSAMKFDGVDDAVALGLPENLQLRRGAKTVGMWVKPNALPPGSDLDLLFYGGGTGGHHGYGMSIRRSSGNLFYEIYGASGGRQNFEAPVGITVGDWQYIVAVFDASNSRMMAYHNGVLYHDVSISNPGEVENSDGFFLGAHNGNDCFFNGSIDEVRVWNRSLTADEIKQQYYSSLNKFAPDKWLFTSTQQSVPAGTYGYSLTATGLNGTTDFTANRTVRVS